MKNIRTYLRKSYLILKNNIIYLKDVALHIYTYCLSSLGQVEIYIYITSHTHTALIYIPNLTKSTDS